jgi:hypothetical protein
MTRQDKTPSVHRMSYCFAGMLTYYLPNLGRGLSRNNVLFSQRSMLSSDAEVSCPGSQQLVSGIVRIHIKDF